MYELVIGEIYDQFNCDRNSSIALKHQILL